MTITAQQKALESRIKQDEISDLAITYLPELNDLPLLRRFPLKNTTLNNTAVFYPDIVDGKAAAIGIQDTVAKSGNIDLKSYQLNINPYIVRFKESLLANFPILNQASDQILSGLFEQKDEFIAKLIDSRSTSAGASAIFDVATFTSKILGIVEAQRTSLKVGIGNTLVIISQNIMNSLISTMIPNTATSYFAFFENTAFQMGIFTEYTSKFTDTVYVFEGSKVDYGKGDDPRLNASFIVEDGALTHSVLEFLFSTDDMKPQDGQALLKQEFTGVLGLSSQSFKIEKETSSNSQDIKVSKGFEKGEK